MRDAARLISSGPATDVPPNFITTMSELSAVIGAAEDSLADDAGLKGADPGAPGGGRPGGPGGDGADRAGPPRRRRQRRGAGAGDDGRNPGPGAQPRAGAQHRTEGGPGAGPRISRDRLLVPDHRAARRAPDGRSLRVF